PESVRSVIQRRIDRLERDELDLLMAASVQGQEFDSRIAGDVLGLGAELVEARLRRLEREHFLVRYLNERELPDSSLSLTYAFGHVMYQHAIYESLTRSRRSALSRAAAEALVKRYRESVSTIATEVALLFELARDFERAADYCIIAASQAASLFANEEA